MVFVCMNCSPIADDRNFLVVAADVALDAGTWLSWYSPHVHDDNIIKDERMATFSSDYWNCPQIVRRGERHEQSVVPNTRHNIRSGWKR